jgi:DNA repair protein RadA/Sms
MTTAVETPHHCRACNAALVRWDNTCPNCKSLGTVVVGKPGKVSMLWLGGGGKPVLLKDVPAEDFERLSTGTREFDRILGGGLVTGSTVLISGDPGIGKSTLLLQVALDLTSAAIVDVDTGKETDPLTILYVSAEETGSQIKGRATRLEGAGQASQSEAKAPNAVKDKARAAAASVQEALRQKNDKGDGKGENKKVRKLYILNESDVEEIARWIREINPDILIIDSIQMMQRRSAEGGSGSLTQVRECTAFIVGLCKESGIGCFLVAHINKDGIVAGPKTLEHLVDATLEFHKVGMGELRGISAGKNRFGDTNEMALFRMCKDGLRSVENPSELLLAHHKEGRPGVAVGLVSVSGASRPYAMEFQTLVGQVLGSTAPKRTIMGLSSGRAAQVIAVLQRRYGIDLLREIFANCPGDHEEVRDPALDLPLAMSLASSVIDVALPRSFIAFGEIGLAGEIRGVSFMESRIRSASLMGFKMIVGPALQPYEAEMVLQLTKTDYKQDEDDGGPKERYYGVSTLEDAFDLIKGFDFPPPEPKQSEVKPEKEGKVLKLVSKKDPKKE